MNEVPPSQCPPCLRGETPRSLPCLTLWQPWATFIALGLKSIESRTHDGFRGLVGKRIAIHAGKTWDKWGMRCARREFAKAGRALPLAHPTWEIIEATARADAGKVIATALVIAHRRLTAADSAAVLGDWSPDYALDLRLWGLVLDEVRPLERGVPATGKQGIWMFAWRPGAVRADRDHDLGR